MQVKLIYIAIGLMSFLLLSCLKPSLNQEKYDRAEILKLVSLAYEVARFEVDMIKCPPPAINSSIKSLCPEGYVRFSDILAIFHTLKKHPGLALGKIPKDLSHVQFTYDSLNVSLSDQDLDIYWSPTIETVSQEKVQEYLYGRFGYGILYLETPLYSKHDALIGGYIQMAETPKEFILHFKRDNKEASWRYHTFFQGGVH